MVEVESKTDMGIWVIIAIVLFVLGSIMALKPSGIDMRLDKLRMQARQLQLYPKLVAYPDWITDGQGQQGMIAQYGMVLDVNLPAVRYQVINEQWRPIPPSYKSQNTVQELDSMDSQTSSKITSSQNQANRQTKVKQSAAYALDKAPLELPPAIAPFVKALAAQANSIVIYWEDAAYVRPQNNPHYKAACITPDLIILKQQLILWAEQLAKAA